MKQIVSVKNLSHSFGHEIILKDINISIDEGEIFGLLGPSGAGKTTLVKMIVGITEPNIGEVWVTNVKMPSLELVKKIGYMAQSDALYNELTARENLEFFGSIFHMKRELRNKRITEVMEVVDLTDHLDKPVYQYSGGMKRRLSLAASLLHEPEMLILDEPTVGIDPVLRESIWKELKLLKKKGKTIILTTHVMDEAVKCDRLSMLRNGKVIASGTPDQLQEETNTESIEAAFLVYGGVK